ncbi:MAG: hypothetical protein AB4372_16600, partial [Xenococcus sp. (in: cyanobacteria)]
NTPISQSTEILEEKTEAVASANDFLAEDLLNTPISQSTEILEEKTEAVASGNDSLAEDLLNTPISQSTEILEEKTEAVASGNDSLSEDLLNTPISQSVDIVEEEVIIVESTDNAPEKTTMPESDNNMPQKDIELEQSDDLLAEEILETPLADLSEKLKSQAIDPNFTQIYSPESQSTSAATTATAVQPVASEKNYQPSNQPSESKKGLLIGGGVAGAIGLLLLLLL